MKTKYIIESYALLLIVLVAGACTSQQGIFGNKSAHEKYTSGLEDAGLSNTTLGRQWKLAAESGMLNPVQVEIPYRETGYFEMQEPRSSGYTFNAKRGERVLVDVQTTPSKGFLLFTELWQLRSGQTAKFLMAADTLTNKLTWDVKEDGTFIVRVQPELLHGMAYTITITTGPSLAFPINKRDNPRVISIWGDPRDGNSRKHEGIDILAKKHTPVVAVSDGVVTSVKENGLGGKVVFFRPNGSDFNLYYAHLDTQLVSTGQRMNAGDPLGTLGNTGNAKNTVAHLHFGIYTGGGAVDPLPFVNDTRPLPRSINADTALLLSMLRIKTNGVLSSEPINAKDGNVNLTAGQAVKAIAATNGYYYVQLPSNATGFVKKEMVTKMVFNKIMLAKEISLYDDPRNDAAIKKLLPKGQAVSIGGTSGNFSFITSGRDKGWVMNSELK